MAYAMLSALMLTRALLGKARPPQQALASAISTGCNDWLTCNGHGRCGSDGKCRCSENHYLPDCHYCWHATTCSGHGRCIFDSASPRVCDCEPGYAGTNCEVQPSESAAGGHGKGRGTPALPAATMQGSTYAACQGTYVRSSDTIGGRYIWDRVSPDPSRFVFWCKNFNKWAITGSQWRAAVIAEDGAPCGAFISSDDGAAEWYDAKWRGSNGATVHKVAPLHDGQTHAGQQGPVSATPPPGPLSYTYTYTTEPAGCCGGYYDDPRHDILNNGDRPTSITTSNGVEWTASGTHDYKPVLDLGRVRRVAAIEVSYIVARSWGKFAPTSITVTGGFSSSQMTETADISSGLGTSDGGWTVRISTRSWAPVRYVTLHQMVPAAGHAVLSEIGVFGSSQEEPPPPPSPWAPEPSPPPPPSSSPPLRCASCELVPCGQCQEGCPPKWCDQNFQDSANWCANGNAGRFPTSCSSTPIGWLVGAYTPSPPPPVKARPCSPKDTCPPASHLSVATGEGCTVGAGTDARMSSVVYASLSGPFINWNKPMLAVIVEATVNGAATAASKQWFACVHNEHWKATLLEVKEECGALVMYARASRYTPAKYSAPPTDWATTVNALWPTMTQNDAYPIYDAHVTTTALLAPPGPSSPVIPLKPPTVTPLTAPGKATHLRDGLRVSQSALDFFASKGNPNAPNPPSHAGDVAMTWAQAIAAGLAIFVAGCIISSVAHCLQRRLTVRRREQTPFRVKIAPLRKQPYARVATA
uniref:EGF-like domain-containing protein n=1 Tax=Calcidiscus leptoporus TaxID=127549 RepID=A0A7S0J0T4_9EUKA|mmetsp:Transcript_33210/g.77622  ORF Transcript_33210/g.77622 Transcript_33210/m.77622 type:complete len:755 (+) Transcript_33210:175-2439(+)